MNKSRRKEVEKAISLWNGISDVFEEIKDIITTAAEEEREYYDNMPEGLQASEKGENADNAATALEEVQEALEGLEELDLTSKLQEAIDL